MMIVAAPEDFTELRRAVEQGGFYTQLRYFDEYTYVLVCVSDRASNGQLCGTSFQVFLAGSRWVLVSYGGLCWRVPPDVSVIGTSLAWLESRSGPGAPPERVVTDHRLEQREAAEYLPELFGKTHRLATLRRFHAAQEDFRRRHGYYARDLDELASSITSGPWFWSDYDSVEVAGNGSEWRAGIADRVTDCRYEIDHSGDYRLRPL